jgi:hypothetical protein
MPKTYVDLVFSSEGASPMTVVETVTKRTGLKFVFGKHDLVIEWESLEQLQRLNEGLTRAVQGLGVFLRFQTVIDAPTDLALTWPPLLPHPDENAHV